MCQRDCRGGSEETVKFCESVCNAWLLKPPNPRVHTCPCAAAPGEESALAVAPVVAQTAPQNHRGHRGHANGIESRIVDGRGARPPGEIN